MAYVPETAAFAAVFSSDNNYDRSSMPSGAIPTWENKSDFITWGEWHGTELRTAEHPIGRVAIVGQCLASQDTINAALESAVTTNNPEKLAAMPGSYAAILLEKDRLTAVGNLVGQPPIYYGSNARRTVVSSRPSIAADQQKPTLDLQYIGAHLTMPGAGGILLGEHTSFAGVTRLQGGDVLRVDHDNSHTYTYQTLTPNPQVSLYDAAERLRGSLTDAVAQRLNLGLEVSSDFSGGLDSSTLAYLAEGLQTNQLPVFFSESSDYYSEDTTYVNKLRELSHGFDFHTFTDPPSTGFTYEQFLDTKRPEDLAQAIAITPDGRRYVDAYYRFIADHGGPIHFTGDGGDEVLGVNSSYLAGLVREGDIRRFGREGLNIARLDNVSPLLLWNKMARLGLGHPSHLLDRLASTIETGDLSHEEYGAIPNATLWQVSSMATSWLTKKGREELAEALHERADNLTIPEGMNISDYIALRGLLASAQAGMTLKYCADSGGSGLLLQTPYFDRDVVAATFSTRATNRGSSTSFKPVLQRAMRGLVPDQLLERRSKGSYDISAFRGLSRSHSALQQILAHSRLADLGIIEPNRIQATIKELRETGNVSMLSVWALERFVSAEGWLATMEAQGFQLPTSAKNTGYIAAAESPREVADPEQDITQSSPQYYNVPSHIYTVTSHSGSLVAYNQQTDTYHTLDRSQSNVLRLLAATNNSEEATRVLNTHYKSSDPEMIRADVQKCIANLIAAGILQGTTEPIRRIIPAKPRTPGFLNEDHATVREQKEAVSFGNRLATAAVFALGSVALNKISPRKRIPLLRWLQEKWCKTEATYEQAASQLRAAQSLPYLGRIACLEAPYTAALTAALKRQRITWHQGVSFEPLQFHAWLEAEGKSVRTELDGQVNGSYQSFFS